MKRILLLDIDGVILPDGQCVDDIPAPDRKAEFIKTFRFDEACCQRVNQLCTEFNSKIILISTWRKIFSQHSDGLQDALVRSGIERSHFYKDSWLAPYKMTSEKVHELGFTREMFDEEDCSVRFLVLDDQFLNVEIWNSAGAIFHQIKTESAVGFSVSDLENALKFWS